jgi:hypothetical protein
MQILIRGDTETLVFEAEAEQTLRDVKVSKAEISISVGFIFS